MVFSYILRERLGSNLLVDELEETKESLLTFWVLAAEYTSKGKLWLRVGDPVVLVVASIFFLNSDVISLINSLLRGNGVLEGNDVQIAVVFHVFQVALCLSHSIKNSFLLICHSVAIVRVYLCDLLEGRNVGLHRMRE